MTTLEHKLWIADYEARQEHSYAEDEIYQAARIWQRKANRGDSRESLGRGGLDPDMFNEYSMVSDACWEELDSHYDRNNSLHQAICKYKRYRAKALAEHRDPGAVPEKVRKYFSLPRSREDAPVQPRQRASAGNRNASDVTRNASAAARNASAAANASAQAARKKAKAAWNQAVQPVSPKDGDGWLWPTIMISVIFAIWGMIFQNYPYSSDGFGVMLLLYFGVGLDMMVNAFIILSIIGKIMEKKGETLSGPMNAYYRMIAFSYNAVRHPIRTTGNVFSKVGENPAALLQLGWLVICWLAMVIGGILIMLVVAGIQAVNDYSRPRRRYYYF